MTKKAIIAGSIFGAMAVALGAFGAHGLADFLETSGRTDTFETAVRYHFYHSLLLVIMGLLGRRISIRLPFYLISAGILIFSGSLYLLIFSDISWLGAITPIGGAALIAGWLALAYNARRMID